MTSESISNGESVAEKEMIEAILEEDASAWIPQAGDEVTGKVLHIQMAGIPKKEGGYGRYPLVEFRVNKGTKGGVDISGTEISIHAFHGTLEGSLREQKVQPGEDYTISYRGKRSGGRFGRGYHVYKVRPLKPRPFSWGEAPRELGDDELG